MTKQEWEATKEGGTLQLNLDADSANHYQTITAIKFCVNRLAKKSFEDEPR